MLHDTQCHTALQTFNTLRKQYPTMFFYFQQTVDETVVVYDRDSQGALRLWSVTLRSDGTMSTGQLVPSMFATHLALVPTGPGQYVLPFLTDRTPCTFTSTNMLQRGTHLAVSAVAHVDAETNTLRTLYLNLVNPTTRTTERQCVECTAAAHTTLAELQHGTSVLWSSFKGVLGY
jgi:hypothetical protein